MRELLQSEAFKNLKPETELAIAVHLGIKKLVYKMRKEELPMCKAFEEILWEEKQCGRREGRKEGRKEGRREERQIIIGRMKSAGIDDNLISSIMSYAGE